MTLEWRALQRVGLSDLRLSPEVFWDLTPFELSLLLGLDLAASPLTFDRFSALTREFPDADLGE